MDQRETVIPVEWPTEAAMKRVTNNGQYTLEVTEWLDAGSPSAQSKEHLKGVCLLVQSCCNTVLFSLVEVYLFTEKTASPTRVRRMQQGRRESEDTCAKPGSRSQSVKILTTPTATHPDQALVTHREAAKDTT